MRRERGVPLATASTSRRFGAFEAMTVAAAVDAVAVVVHVAMEGLSLEGLKSVNEE